MRIDHKIGITLWKMNLLPDNQCPVCNNKLLKHFPKDCYEWYTCKTTKCPFNK